MFLYIGAYVWLGIFSWNDFILCNSNLIDISILLSKQSNKVVAVERFTWLTR